MSTLNSSGMEARKSLASLPDELLRAVFELLSPSDLRQLNLVSRWTREYAATLLWRNVKLVDCTTVHWPSTPNVESEVLKDQHDDTPLIRTLLLLARDPFIASKVQTLTHRCHLPNPGIWSELPLMSFQGTSLSRDIRTLDLLEAAIENLVNVQTLIVIFGHWNLTVPLLRGFLRSGRRRLVPLRRLWLESCSIEGIGLAASDMDLSGLESFRVRRLRVSQSPVMHPLTFVLARSLDERQLQDQVGGYYVASSDTEPLQYNWSGYPFENRSLACERAQELDAKIYEALPEAVNFLSTRRSSRDLGKARPFVHPFQFLINVLNSASDTITSLNLDWIRTEIPEASDESGNDYRVPYVPVSELAELRFPNLRSFQWRNAIIEDTPLPPGIYLLGPGTGDSDACLRFMEAHPNLESLAWPMDRFYSHNKTTPEIASRARAVVDNLSRTLRHLRVDALFSARGERLTDDSTDTELVQAKIRRRKFVKLFAPYMTSIEQLKIEGGVPRDEKRETIRALSRCPIRKLVLIGVSSQIGNTWRNSWVEGTEHLSTIYQHDDSVLAESGLLEETHIAPTGALASNPSTAVAQGPVYEPSYGWPSVPPLLHYIAASYAATITELKFCGYIGAPILHAPTPWTSHLLSPLREFHKLKYLILSMWLVTRFEDEYRDHEITTFWNDRENPSSTALAAPVSPGVNAWADFLEEKFSPSALADYVVKMVAPVLSDEAKAQPGGISVRASFCLGLRTGDIFDLELRVGPENKAYDIVGPRAEGGKDRINQKLEGRQWFWKPS